MSSTAQPLPTDRAVRRGLWWAAWTWATDPAQLALWGVILLAAVLRLAHLDLVEFKSDEANHLLRAAQILQEHRLPLVGSQASLGIAKPPMMSLLMTLPLLLGRDPRLASGFIALLNVGAVAGCFLTARRYYGLRVAVIAGLLFAANPWAVLLSRKVFTADVLAPFLTLFLYALHVALVDRAGWGWLLAIGSLGVMLSITFSPALLALVLVVLAVAYRRRVNWRYLMAGVALVFLLLVPYLYTQLAHPRQVIDLLRTLLHGGGDSKVSTAALQVATWVHSGRNLGSVTGGAFPLYAPAHSPLRALDGVAALLFLLALPVVVGLGWAARRRQGGKSGDARYGILAAWLLVSLVVLSLGIVDALPHYLVVLYPAGFVAMAVLVDRAWAASATWSKGRTLWAKAPQVGLGALVVAAVVWQSYSVLSLYDVVGHENTGGAYGTPLQYWLEVSAMVRHEAGVAGTSEVWAIADGTDPTYEETPAILNYLLGPDLQVTFLGQGGNEALLLPAGQPALYLLMRPVAPVVEAMLGRLNAQETARQPGRDGRPDARVLVAPAQPEADLRQLISERAEWTLSPGPRLLGYDWPAAHPGETVELATFWEFGDVSQEARSTVHSLFNHVLDAGGDKVAQRDGFGLPERYWRPGLMLVQWFALPLPAELPAGDYTLLTGMYGLGDFARSRVLDGTGADVGDSISLGPVRVSD